jgi:tetratricopeptide (TPR) repeat protein
MTLVKDNKQETKDARQRGPVPLARRVEAFLIAHRIMLLSLLGIIIIGSIGAGVFFSVSETLNKKGLAQLDEISTALANNSGDSYETREQEALLKLEALAQKRSIVGARANMLMAEIHFNAKRYEQARDAWLKAAQHSSASYIAPLSWYNAAVCSEELGQTEDAFTYYEKAGAQKDFALKTHALFNAGRVKDEALDFEGAAAKYQELNDKYSGDSWANLAMTRLITLRAEGKIQ